MTEDLEPKDDELENLIEDEIKDELFESDILMQEEIDYEEFEEKLEALVDVDEDEDEDEEKESINNSINFDDAESELDVYFKYGTNNHKLDGKHSLKRDTILNEKLTEKSRLDDATQMYGMEFELHDTGDISIERGNMFEEESKHRKLAENVYYLLKNNTELDFRSNRRKPNKATFNNYYKMLLSNIDKQYTKSEIFVELAYYFTDNIFNMYKLLDKKYATTIIMELREKGFLNNLNSINFM